MFKSAATLIALLLATQASALTIDLGPASDYNLFIKENFSQPGADSQGKIAVGGNANIGSYDVGVNYEPGSHRDGQQFWTNANQYEDVLVVGGDLTTGQWSWGNIKGNLVLGGQLTAGSSANSVLGATKHGNPIDFGSAFDYFSNLSGELAGLDNTGGINFAYGNWLQLLGTSEDDLYIANITGDTLRNATDLSANGLTQSDTLVINVSGKNVNFDSLNYGAREASAALDLSPSHILYNFYEAENISFSGGFKGNILAPNANFNFMTGDLSGQVIAKFWTGNWGAQANLWDGFFSPYDHGEPPVTEVSESSSWVLMLIGFAGLLLIRYRNRRSLAAKPAP